MRTLRITFCLVASFATTISAQKQPAVPPKPAALPKRADPNSPTAAIVGLPPRLTLIEGPAIDGKKHRLERELSVYLGPGGLQLVGNQMGVITAFDSTGRRLWSLETGLDSEIGDVAALGWRGSQIWISDRRFSQIALVDKGAVTKSLELPVWVRPAWINRKRFPVYGAMEVDALLADGSMIVLPRRPHTLAGTVGYDSTMQYVLHVTENGIIDRQIAKLATFELAFRSMVRALPERPDARPDAWPLPVDYWPRLRVSPDGMRTVIVSVDTTHAGTDSIVVSAVNEKGEPAWGRRFGFPRKTYTRREADSMALVRFPRSSAFARAAEAKTLARNPPSVHDVILGRDHSVWVTLREIDGARAVVGIDSTGQLAGTVYLPRTFSLRAADGNHLWIVDNRPILRDVVRYSISPNSSNH